MEALQEFITCKLALHTPHSLDAKVSFQDPER